MTPALLSRILTVPRDHVAERSFGLDLVRSLAIGLVVLGHGANFIPFSRVAGLVLWNGGFFGVELFFALSGFLIGGILLRTFDRHPATPGTIGRFWVRRWFRTLPNYFLFLLLAVTLFGAWFRQAPFDPRYLLFLQNLAWRHPPLMPEAWSLSVEEWFYVLFPLVALVCAWLPFGRRRTFLVALVVYLGATTLLRFAQAGAPGMNWDLDVRKVVIHRLDAVGYGVTLAYLSFHWGDRVRSWAGPLLGLGLAMIAFCVWRVSTVVSVGPSTPFDRTWLFTLTSLGFALWLPWFAALPAPRPWLVRAVAHVSVVSYSMYLVHFSLARPLVMERMPGLPWWLAYLAYVAITVAVSTLVYNLFERPTTDLRDRFAPRRPR